MQTLSIRLIGPYKMWLIHSLNELWLGNAICIPYHRPFKREDDDILWHAEIIYRVLIPVFLWMNIMLNKKPLP